MEWLQLLVLAVIQGLTEFLPISSSAHLILPAQLFGWQDQGLAFDVAVHIGTLLAVMLYFRRDVALAMGGLPRLVRGRVDTQGAWLMLLLIVATVPVMVAGLVLKLTGLIDLMRSIEVIGWAMIVFGVLLYWADQKGPEVRGAARWSLRHAVILGLWQAVALIPGTSRSGICITGGRFLGYDRESTAKISMLMSIPTIIASGGLLSLDIIGTDTPGLLRDASIAAVFAFIAALIALVLMMRLLRTISFTPYVIYRIALGVVLLAIAYG